MSSSLSQSSPGLSPIPPSDSALLRAVDSVPETHGAGVVLLANGIARTLRRPPPGGPTIVFEVRPSPVAKSAPRPAHPRTAATSPAREWLSLGFNCGGTVLAWVGVVGTAATAPATGGQSLFAATFLWAGALATSASCAVAVFRLGAMATGRESVDAALDQDSFYHWTMIGLDGAGLIGVGGAIRDIIKTRDALEASGVGWRKAMSGQLTYRQRRALTGSMDLVGTTKSGGGPMIGAVVKQRLLAAVAAAVGMAGSASSGAIHDLVVWIVYPHEH